jgi:hypothetical protein
MPTTCRRIALAIAGRVPVSAVDGCRGDCLQGRECNCTPTTTEDHEMLRPDFLTQPGQHLRVQRDGLSHAERCTAVHGPYTAEQPFTGGRLLAAVAVVAIVAAVVLVWPV